MAPTVTNTLLPEGATATPTATVRTFGPVMPHPGQPGALHFDKANVSEFLRQWNLECEDFGLSDTQKCARLPRYCATETKEVVELLGGYVTSDWRALQKEMKSLFAQYDTQKNTTASLCER